MWCTHYSGTSESTGKQSVSAGLRQDILDRYRYRRRDVIPFFLVGWLLTPYSTI